MVHMSVLKPFIVAIATACMLPCTSRADFNVAYTGSGTGGRSASATFTQTGETLTVTLTNTGGDVTDPTQVLTGVFFNVAGDPTLGKTSALLGAGSTVLFAPASAVTGSLSPAGPDLGGEWAYLSGLNQYSANQGISSAGLGIFGPGDRFRTDSNLEGPDSVDGLQYGITSGSDNPSTGNAAVTGANALIQNSVVFRFSGAMNLTAAGLSDVTFQYGTALDDVSIHGRTVVPVPPSVFLMAIGGVGIFGLSLWARRGNPATA
jgi:hypothetical protein